MSSKGGRFSCLGASCVSDGKRRRHFSSPPVLNGLASANPHRSVRTTLSNLLLGWYKYNLIHLMIIIK